MKHNFDVMFITSFALRARACVHCTNTNIIISYPSRLIICQLMETPGSNIYRPTKFFTHDPKFIHVYANVWRLCVCDAANSYVTGSHISEATIMIEQMYEHDTLVKEKDERKEVYEVY